MFKIITGDKQNTIYLVWLLPVAYIFHLIEEYFAGSGFPVWISENLQATLSNAEFLIINVVALSAVLFFATYYTWWKQNTILLLALYSLVFINGVVHLLSSILTLSYAPGTLTGIVLYIPMGILAYKKILPLLRPIEQTIGITLGIIIQALVAFIALNI